MSNKVSIYEFLRCTTEQQNDAWHDWFCRDSALHAKTKKLVKKLSQLVLSRKFSINETYISFKNSCPVVGSLYDDFRILDLKTSDVIYTIIPSSGHKIDKGRAEVWGKENDFATPLVVGTWSDVKRFFLETK